MSRDRVGKQWPVAVVATLAVITMLFSAVGAASGAGATTTGPAAPAACDPAYGCPPPTSPPTLSPTCSISATTVSPGGVVTATLRDVPPGTHGKLLFDGTVVAEGDASGSGASGSLTLSFVVPNDTPPGNHSVVFVGAGFQCDATGRGGVSVLGTVVLARSDNGPSTGGSKGGSLARTGMQIALFLAVALVLILLGTSLVRAARRRRRRRARALNAVDDFVNH